MNVGIRGVKRFVLFVATLAILLVLLLLICSGSANAQTEYIFDQESYSYPAGALTYVSQAGFYSDTARIMTTTSDLYAQYELSLPQETIYLLYTWILTDAGYGAMRYTVDEQYLDTLDFSDSPAGWNLVGQVVVGMADTDPPILVIDRADTGSGDLVVDAIRLVSVGATETVITDLTATVAYSLPTTGDTMLYNRHVDSGQIMVAAPMWALLMLLLVREIWRVARGDV